MSGGMDLSTFPEENPNPVLRVDRKGAVLFANQAGRRLSGLFDDDLLEAGLRDSVDEAWAAGESRAGEFRSGDYIFAFTLTPVPDAGYVNLYGRGVTEERRALAEVHNLARFPEENPNPVLRVQRDGDVLFAN